MDEKYDPFSGLDFSLEEALEADEKLKSKPADRDGRICICGHAVVRHTTVSGLVFCKPTRMECPCKKMRPVLDADDIRPFLRKTEGAGALHALGRGLAAASSKNVKVEWIVDFKCDRCQKDSPIAPVPVTQRGTAMSSATGFDALLCRECREVV